jgi:F0F1-type ATP synthase epsilon subunit
MPLTIHFDIVSAEALIYSGPATKVVLPAEEEESVSWRVMRHH